MENETLSKELRIGAYRSVALLYMSGCLYASAVTTETGDAFLFAYMHLAFFVAVLALAASRGFVVGLWRSPLKSWPAAFLVLFLLYWLLMGLTHDNPVIGIGFTKNVFNRAIPGFLLGYIVFSTYGSNKFSVISCKDRQWSPRVFRYLIDLTSIFVYLFSLYYSFHALLPYMQSRIFLVAVDPGRINPYQIFGNYIFLSLLCAIYLIDPYIRGRCPKSILASGVWALGLTIACWASFFLSQLVGSNTGAAVAIFLGFYGFIFAMSEIINRRWMRGLVVIIVLSITTIGAQKIIIELPPMRIFGFS